MAIVSCPECNNSISEKAIMCPHCGYKIKKGKNRSLIAVIIGISFILLLGAVIVIKNLNNIPSELELTLDMDMEDVHKKLGNKYSEDVDKYGHTVEVYNVKAFGQQGNLSVTYSSDNLISSWRWDIDVSDMSDSELETVMNKIQKIISNQYGEPQISNVSRLQYKWVTSHTEKHNVLFDVGYELIRDKGLWIWYGEVY